MEHKNEHPLHVDKHHKYNLKKQNKRLLDYGGLMWIYNMWNLCKSVRRQKVILLTNTAKKTSFCVAKNLICKIQGQNAFYLLWTFVT